MILLALDIGNAMTKAGIFRDNRLMVSDAASTPHLEHDPNPWLRALAARAGITRFEHLAIASVVPSASQAWLRCAQEQLDIRAPLVITGETPTPLQVTYCPKVSLGADRLANAVAAADLYGMPCICASVGTATVIDAVSADGVFLGGAILPGVDLLLDSLALRTAQLPRVSTEAPKILIGNNTDDSIRSGAVIGTAAAIEGLAQRFVGRLGKRPALVITGGHAALVMPHLVGMWRHRPTLGLEGTHLIWQHARKQRDETRR